MDYSEIFQTIKLYLRKQTLPSDKFKELFSWTDSKERKQIRLELEKHDIQVISDEDDPFDEDDYDADEFEVERQIETDETDEDNPFNTIDGFTETDEEDDPEEELPEETQYRRFNNGSKKTFYQKIKDLTPKNYESNEYLLNRYKHGDESAVEELVIRNNKLVWKSVFHFKKIFPDMDKDDLFQAGVLGMITSIQRFDLSLGTKFSTYSVYWIKQSILRFIYDNLATIRIPVHMMEKISKINKLDRRYYSDGIALDKRISLIAKDLGESENDILFALEVNNNIINRTSLDKPIDETGSFLTEILVQEDDEEPDLVEQIAYRELVGKILDTLNPREREIIIKRFGLNGEPVHTLEELGQEFNVTRERIRQIEEKVIKRVQNNTALNKEIKETIID